MCDTNTSTASPSRRSILGAAMAGAGGILAASFAATPASAAPAPRPLTLELPTQPTGTLLTQLGTAGGPQAEYGRTGTATVLTVEGHNYLVDAGRSSVTQYLNAGLAFGKLAGIFITHLHADHLADYYNFFLLESGQPNAEGDMLATRALPVFGPGPAGALPPQPPRPIGPVPTIAPDDPTPGLKELTQRMTEAYAYSYNVFLRGDGYQPITVFTGDVNEIALPNKPHAGPRHPAPTGMKPFQIFEDERVRVSAVLVPHGSVFPCFAYRFDLADGRSVVFSGDTSKSDNVITLAQGADMLVHEVMEWEIIYAAAVARGVDPDTDPLLHHLRTSHTTTDEVAQVAQAAGVPQLVLTHLIPSNPRDVPDFIWQTKCSAGYTGNVHVGHDLDQLPVVPRARMRFARRRG